MVASRLAVAVIAALLAAPAAGQQPQEPPPTAPPAAGPPTSAPAAPAEPPTSLPATPEERAPSAPAPAAPRDAGLTFALRGSFLKPHGIVAGRQNPLPLDFEFSSGVQLTAEAGYRFPAGATVGLYAKAGVARPRSTALDGLCSAALRCDDGYTRKIGAEVLYHFLRDRPLSPWVGAGVGYEWTGYHVADTSPGGGAATVTYQGWELLDAQIGVDYAVAPRFFLGIFVANSFGRFETVRIGGSGATVQADIASKATHDWLQIGVRGRWDP